MTRLTERTALSPESSVSDSRRMTDLERLQLLFKRVGALPPLSNAVHQLIRTIDTGDASAADLERIIASDPALTANFLRSAAASADRPSHASSLRRSLMHMGQRAARSIAVSLLLKDLVKESGGMRPAEAARYARHSLTVGVLSRYLYARRQQREPFESQWSADEVFAAGLLHDISLGLLASVAPESYHRVAQMARRMQSSYSEAFKKIYGVFPTELGATALEAWNLPELFASTQRYMHEPWNYDREYTPLCCLAYANYLAEISGRDVPSWPVTPPLLPEVEMEIVLPEAERARVMELVERHVDESMAPVYGEHAAVG